MHMIFRWTRWLLLSNIALCHADGEPCAGGSEYLMVVDSSFTCRDCTICPQGSGILEQCQGTMDTRCTNCTEGKSYSRLLYDQRVCEPCTDCASRHHRMEEPCTLYTDAICGECEEGYELDHGVNCLPVLHLIEKNLQSLVPPQTTENMSRGIEEYQMQASSQNHTPENQYRVRHQTLQGEHNRKNNELSISREMHQQTIRDQESRTAAEKMSPGISIPILIVSVLASFGVACILTIGVFCFICHKKQRLTINGHITKQDEEEQDLIHEVRQPQEYGTNEHCTDIDEGEASDACDERKQIVYSSQQESPGGSQSTQDECANSHVIVQADRMC